ncbi:MAG: YkvA family protein [Sulfurimonas sp.]|nr:YkvA family protein [Sulfurimonas sp.]
MSAIPQRSSDIKAYAKKFDNKKATSYQKRVSNSALGDKLRMMLKMINDKDFTIDPKTKLIYVGAIGYLIMPFDVVADYIPVVGLLDDAAVMKIVWDNSLNEIKRYLGFAR